MILLLDNYDSFVYNLYQQIGKFRPEITVVRSRDITVPEVRSLHPEAIFLSPGPGRPENAGVCVELIRQLGSEFPIFGVCLGHQAICCAYGGTVSYAKELLHGKSSIIYPEAESRLMGRIDIPFKAARYHSLAVMEAGLPACLRVSARTMDGEIMAIEHETYPVFGVQFHPESVLTPNGDQILQNFFSLIGGTKHD